MFLKKFKKIIEINSQFFFSNKKFIFFKFYFLLFYFFSLLVNIVFLYFFYFIGFKKLHLINIMTNISEAIIINPYYCTLDFANNNVSPLITAKTVLFTL